MSKKAFAELKNRMKNAKSYADYKDAAEAHDDLSGAQEWKATEVSKVYDYRTIRARVERMRLAKSNNDATALMYIIHEGLHGNLGNISAPALNGNALIGTKHLIEEYIQEVCGALDFIYQADEIDFYEKLSFFDETTHAFGRSCIMLSGGAGLGFFHAGVVKTLVEHDVLPDVISGASAGSIVAALVGTRTNEELLEILTPEVIYSKFNKWLKWQGFGKEGLFDSTHLENALIELFDLTTFEEAYKKTGRHMTITVSAADLHQYSRLLNAQTSPNAVIAQASRASCALPIMFSPVQLKAKNQAGEIVPYIPNRRFADGSIMADLPFDRLARLYGVNHSIVSQINPLSTFVKVSIKRDTSSFLELSKRYVSKLAKINSIYAFDVLEGMVSHKKSKMGIQKLRSIVDQQYLGNINILPTLTKSNIKNLAFNPTLKGLAELFETGERATWPQLDLIKRNTIISKTLRQHLNSLKAKEAEILSNNSELKVVNN